MTTPNSPAPEPGPDAGVDDIRADIEATRTELGHTVEALTAKLDVKQQAKQKVDDTKGLLIDKADALREKGSQAGTQIVDATTDASGTVRPAVPVAALAFLAVVVGVILWRRRG